MARKAIPGRGSEPLHRAKCASVKGLNCCYRLTHQQQVRVSAAGLLRRWRRRWEDAGSREGRSAVCRGTAPTARSACRAGQCHPDYHICCRMSWQLASLRSVPPGSLHPLPAHWGSHRALWGGQGQGEPQLSPLLLLAEQVLRCKGRTSPGAAPTQPRR